jgi:hypothetical protein
VLSEKRFLEKRCEVLTTPETKTIKRNERVVLQANVANNGLYYVNVDAMNVAKLDSEAPQSDDSIAKSPLSPFKVENFDQSQQGFPSVGKD